MADCGQICCCCFLRCSHIHRHSLPDHDNVAADISCARSTMQCEMVSHSVQSNWENNFPLFAVSCHHQNTLKIGQNLFRTQSVHRFRYAKWLHNWVINSIFQTFFDLFRGHFLALMFFSFRFFISIAAESKIDIGKRNYVFPSHHIQMV